MMTLMLNFHKKGLFYDDEGEGGGQKSPEK